MKYWCFFPVLFVGLVIALSLSAPERVKAQLTMTNIGPGSFGGSAAAPTWTATGNPAGQNNGLSSVTFTSVGIGSPAASDVIVAIYSSTSTVATSLTCNSNAMTKQIEESSIISGLQIWSITASSCGVTGSATTTFVASTGGGAMNEETLLVGKMTGVQATPPDTGVAASGTSISVTVPSTGVAVVGAFQNATTVLSWTGGIEDFHTNNGSDSLLMVHATATGSVSETPTGSGVIHFVYAAWGP